MVCCCNPKDLLTDYYFVLTKTTKDDWQTIFNNLGLIQALILSTAYGVSGWIEYSDLDDCGLGQEFYIYTNIVQNLGLAGVVISILMVQFAGMAATDEKKAQEALGELTPLFVTATIVDALITLVIGLTIVLLDENVHNCQYMIIHGGERLNVSSRFPSVLWIRIIVWAVTIIFALIAVICTSKVTANYLKSEDPTETEFAVVDDVGEKRQPYSTQY